MIYDFKRHQSGPLNVNLYNCYASKSKLTAVSTSQSRSKETWFPWLRKNVVLVSSVSYMPVKRGHVLKSLREIVGQRPVLFWVKWKNAQCNCSSTRALQWGVVLENPSVLCTNNSQKGMQSAVEVLLVKGALWSGIIWYFPKAFLVAYPWYVLTCDVCLAIFLSGLHVTHFRRAGSPHGNNLISSQKEGLRLIYAFPPYSLHLRTSGDLQKLAIHKSKAKSKFYWHNNVEHAFPIYTNTTGTHTHTQKNKINCTRNSNICMIIRWNYSIHEQYILPLVLGQLTIILSNKRNCVLLKAADDDAGNLQPVFLKRLYLLRICIFSFFLFNTSLTTI